MAWAFTEVAGRPLATRWQSDPQPRLQTEWGGPRGRKPREGEQGTPDGTAGDPDLPQTLGPPAYAPYPSPVLSEEEDLLLDNPALEVSDSESDEALMAGPEGGASEAGKWKQVGWGLPQEAGGGGCRAVASPACTVHPGSEGDPGRVARARASAHFPAPRPPVCRGVAVTVTIPGVWEGPVGAYCEITALGSVSLHHHHQHSSTDILPVSARPVSPCVRPCARHPLCTASSGELGLVLSNFLCLGLSVPSVKWVAAPPPPSHGAVAKEK